MDPIPADVKQFMEANVESVDQLEILRILGEDSQREWRPVDLSAEVQTSATTLRAHLESLYGRGLLVLWTRGEELLCRYGPRDAELAERLGRLLQVYRERPVTMIRHIYARAKDPLRTLADAFRFKQGS